MKTRIGIHTVLVVFLSAWTASAMFMMRQVDQVPLPRLITNLTLRLSTNSESVELTYDLARLHSMAYATNSPLVDLGRTDGRPSFGYPGSDAGVPRSVVGGRSPEDAVAARAHLTNAIAFYDRALSLLRRSTNATEQEWLILPMELGRAWCLEQAGRTNDALDGYRKVLKIAWKREVTGDFELKEWLDDVWTDLKNGRNPVRSRNRGFIGPGVCFSEEAIGYLLNLLDPVKDSAEIARLQKDRAELAKMPRAITPVLVPLEAGLPLDRLVDPHASVPFDLDGTGLARRWGWITPKAAWLVYDPRRTGKITSALQMFGNVAFWVFWRDGYAAMSGLDDNNDGKLEGDELEGLALWRDENSNGVSDPGEVKPLSEHGIVCLSCRSTMHASGIPWSDGGAELADGTSRSTYDWMVPTAVTGATSISTIDLNQTGEGARP